MKYRERIQQADSGDLELFARLSQYLAGAQNYTKRAEKHDAARKARWLMNYLNVDDVPQAITGEACEEFHYFLALRQAQLEFAKSGSSWGLDEKGADPNPPDWLKLNQNEIF